MADKPYQFKVDLPEGYSKDIRDAIASEIVSFVRQRTLKGVDYNGKSFPKYSTPYTKSVDFRAAGKSKKVDLTLSGDMLAYLDVVKIKKDQLIIGYEDSSAQAGKAEGNQIGSYGRQPNSKKARKFLGLTDSDLDKILKKYPLDNPEKSEERAAAISVAQGEIDRQLEKINVEEMTDEQKRAFFQLKVGPNGK